ncbi:hypothetical protein X928_06280 [Petrotoga miotherma DSM 10691]|uniref:Uncharacterized protein n=2 Tax=Petrotoga TaxID=28236 RepID=A0A2K1PAT4_9BACT|nr:MULTISPECIES: hypothetical protein [Petrotoga]PNR99893.1 hypothetical protein X928_06280 [Petrotoga miotherma DSM 10691]POZ93543.1 hypothetical protein AA81_01070 [Petrotoga halophila DSM 16923]
MQYFSKSPEEWQKYDEERKKEKERREQPKKRIIRWTFYIVIFLSILSLIFIIIGRRGSRFDLPYNVVIKGIHINLESKEEYYYPDNLDIKVTIQNTNNKDSHITINNFSFLIVNQENSEVVYSYVFPQPVETDISPYKTILVFDLLREKEISNLDKGTYEARVTFVLNDENVNLVKTFNYNKGLIIDVSAKDMFYLTTEFPSVSILAVNGTNETFNKELFGTLTIKQNEKVIHSQKFSFGTLNLNPLSSIPLDFEINKKLDPGNYYVLFDFNSLEQTYATTLNIVNQTDKNYNDISLLVYVISAASRGDQLDFEGLLRNSNKQPRAFEISQVRFKLFYEEQLIYNYENNDLSRVYIPELGTTRVFDLSNVKTITLDRSGKYEIQFSVKIGDKIFSKKHTVEVY